jgi:hypothetical protein
MAHGVTILGKVVSTSANATSPVTHSDVFVDYVVHHPLGIVGPGNLVAEVLNSWTDQEMELYIREKVAEQVSTLANELFTAEDVRGCKI